jgi:hypothetical protein
VPPGKTCITDGENAKFCIVAVAAITGIVPFDVGFVELFDLLPQLVNKTKPDIRTKAKEMILVFITNVYLNTAMTF